MSQQARGIPRRDGAGFAVEPRVCADGTPAPLWRLIEDDPRLLPCNGRVAAAELEGEVEARRFVDGELLRCKTPVADIRSSPGGGLASQLVRGERFRVLEAEGKWAFGQSMKDAYVGYALRECLEDMFRPTHWVATLHAHIYPEPAFKTVPLEMLPFGSQLAAASESGDFIGLDSGGFVPAAQVRKRGDPLLDFVSTAELFLGVPYLWGGTGSFGIDCSGLVQRSLEAAGTACPRDSDMQECELGKRLRASVRLERGDLVFWPGHVGIMADQDVLLHATARHMAVVKEELKAVAARIIAAEGHRIRAIRRIPEPVHKPKNC